jgi:hypothetical protein
VYWLDENALCVMRYLTSLSTGNKDSVWWQTFHIFGSNTLDTPNRSHGSVTREERSTHGITAHKSNSAKQWIETILIWNNRHKRFQNNSNWQNRAIPK